MTRIPITCPFCITSGHVPESYFGQRVRCKRCRETFPVTSQVRGSLEEIATVADQPVPVKTPNS